MPLPDLRMSPPIRRNLVAAFASVSAIVGLTRPAKAAEPTMAECLSANESAIKLRGDHKLRQARDRSLVCSATTCPGEVRDTCQHRVRDLNAAIPTVVFLAKDGAGHDLVAVRVSMDGEPIGDRLDGTAIPVDPGQHTFKFEVTGQPPVDLSLVVGEGQKDRRETVTLGGAAVAATASPTPASPGVGKVPPAPNPGMQGESQPAAGAPGGGQRIFGIVAGAVGVVGLGLGGVFGGLAASDWSKAKAACNGKPVSCTTDPNSTGFQGERSATTMATLSTVSFIAGGVLAAGGVVVFLTAPRTPSSEAHAAARGVELVPTGGPAGMGMLIRGRF